jgi:hypothetical protein
MGSVQGCHGLWISDPQASENTSKRTLNALLSVLAPPVIDFRWMLQGLHYHTILFGFLLQRAQLLPGCLRGTDVERDPDVLKSDSRLFGNSQRPLEVQVTFDRNIDALRRYAHRSGHHLTGDLRACGDCTQE